MFSLVMDCPFCRQRFNYDQTQKGFPPELTCPECGKTGQYQDFSAVVLCQQCHKKLLVPLEIFYNDDTLCPHCHSVLKTDLPFLDEDASTYTLGGTRRSRADERILQDGTFFDKYKIIRLLGKGGMAEVYLAEHLLLKKQCALKLMQSSVAAEDPVFTKRFIREAKLSHQMEHPNIINVFDAGSDFKTGHLFLAMEYVEGKTLSQLSREKKLTEQELLKVLCSMINALKVLEKANVVHRDIKPSNIMLNTDGVWKLMDLGIAKSNSNHQAGELTLTMDQSVIGTPGYASPEQCRSAHNVDIRSDLYCLGATLYHAASGFIPHDGETPMEIILKVLQEEPEPLKKYRPDLSPRFLSIIEKMMQKKPEDRPSTPEEVLDIYYAGKGVSQKISQFFKTAGERLSNYTQPDSTHKFLSGIGKILKGGFFLLLIACITLAAFYITQKPEIKRLETFPQYVRRIIKRQPAPASPLLSPSPQKVTHPLMKYPGEEKTQEPRMISGVLHFPVVTPSESRFPSHVFEFDRDHSKRDMRESFFSNVAKHCRDGIFHADECRQKKGYFAFQELGGYFFHNDQTVSIDLRLDSKNKNLLEWLNFALCWEDDKLEIQAKENYRKDIYSTKIPFPVKQGEWFNITFTVQRKNKKLTLLSGNKLLGIFMIPESIPHFFMIKFDLHGKIERLVLHKHAQQYMIPQPAQMTFAPLDFSKERLPAVHAVQSLQQQRVIQKTAQPAAADRKKQPDQITQAAQLLKTVLSPAPAQKTDPEPTQKAASGPAHAPVFTPPVGHAGPRSIEQRLAECRERYRFLSSRPDFHLKEQTLDFIRKQISALERQQKIKENVRSVDPRSYSEEDTRQLTKLFSEVYKSNKQFSSNYQLYQNIQKSLKGNFNPHAKVWDPKRRKMIPLAEFNLFHSNTSFQKTFVSRLIEQKVNTNLLSSSHMPPTLLLYGNDDIDAQNGEGLFKIANTLTPWYTLAKLQQAGKNYEIKLIESFLLLAPRLSCKDPDGNTLLHLAASRNQPTVIRSLYLSGMTDPHITNNQGLTPWQCAMSAGSVEALNELKQLNMQTRHTPAAELQFNFCKSILDKDTAGTARYLKSGADPYKPWYNSLNALQNACASSSTQVVDTLLKNGVVPERLPFSTPLDQPDALAVKAMNIPTLTLYLKSLKRPKYRSGGIGLGLRLQLRVHALTSRNPAPFIIAVLKTAHRYGGLDFDSTHNPLILQFLHFPQNGQKEILRYLLNRSNVQQLQARYPHIRDRLDQIFGPNWNPYAKYPQDFQNRSSRSSRPIRSSRSSR